jgi:hypothetical protein
LLTSKVDGNNKENNGNRLSNRIGKSIKICKNKAYKNRGNGRPKRSSSLDKDKEWKDKTIS